MSNNVCKKCGKSKGLKISNNNPVYYEEKEYYHDEAIKQEYLQKHGFNSKAALFEKKSDKFVNLDMIREFEQKFSK